VTILSVTSFSIATVNYNKTYKSGEEEEEREEILLKRETNLIR